MSVNSKGVVRHFWQRFFRGALVDTYETAHGTLTVYSSGYVELTTVAGECIDCWWAERRGRIPWHCVGSQGVGAFVTSPMTIDEAKKHVVEVAGDIIHVDIKRGHIFYRQNLSARRRLT